jgi:hypothetical protein
MIKTNLIRQENWCRKQGADFILVIPPNKETIYPEMYDSGIKKIQKESRLDQLIQYLETNTDIGVVDVREELFSAKSKAQLYYKNDTHWNNYGAFIGYQAIQKQIAKSSLNIETRSVKSYKIVESNILTGDLVNMMFLDRYQKDLRYDFVPKNKTLYKFVTLTEGIGGKIITELNNKSLPKAVMVRDSFTTSMIPFLSNDFSRIVYDWEGTINYDLIKEERPDIVIYEMVERSIGSLTKDIPDEIK